MSGQLVHGQEMLLCDFGKTAHAKYLPTEDCDVPRNEFKKNSSYLHLLSKHNIDLLTSGTESKLASREIPCSHKW